jgi:plasmid stabilization system protein ParE
VTRYILSPAAKQDLTEIRNYLVDRASRDVARRVLHELRKAMVSLAESPGIGHVRYDLAPEPIRFYRVYKYLLVYRFSPSSLGIVRVLHAARDVRSILESKT